MLTIIIKNKLSQIKRLNKFIQTYLSTMASILLFSACGGGGGGGSVTGGSGSSVSFLNPIISALFFLGIILIVKKYREKN
ncbi:MAG: hypothetical protein HRT52_15530 [Colwellia sp.]|nr:hypothetical protein [Colwellia sp.]